MKAIVFLAILVLYQQRVACWIGLIEYNPFEFEVNNVTDLDAHCFTTIKNLGKFQKGEVKRLPDTCAIATCKEDRSIDLSGCAPIFAMPPCHVGPGNLSKPFSECCHEIICGEPLTAVLKDNDNQL